jgi:hypothetical protein
MPIPSPSSVLLRTQSDERLVSLARGGSERAFEAIVERYRGGLLRLARRYLPDARAAEQGAVERPPVRDAAYIALELAVVELLEVHPSSIVAQKPRRSKGSL